MTNDIEHLLMHVVAIQIPSLIKKKNHKEKTKSIIEEKEGHYIMIKGSIKDITTLINMQQIQVHINI